MCRVFFLICRVTTVQISAWDLMSLIYAMPRVMNIIIFVQDATLSFVSDFATGIPRNYTTPRIYFAKFNHSYHALITVYR